MIVLRNILTGEVQTVFSADGYDPAIWANEGALFEAIDPSCVKWDGVNGVIVEDASRLDAELHAKIDREAGAFTLRFITDIPGQAQRYEYKAREAADWIAAVDPDPANYPFLVAEAQASGMAPGEVAIIINAAAAQWILIAAKIDGVRVGAKRAVTTATTALGKRAAAAVNWEALLG